MESQALEYTPPHPSGRQTLFKTLIGLFVGLFVAFLIFIILMLIGGIIIEALQQRLTGNVTINPLLPLILIVISFLGTFIGSVIIAGAYNLIYTDTYYDLGKMFSITLMSNILLFFFFLPLYLIFSNNIQSLFVVLAFHMIFSIYVGFVAIEITTNPNYAVLHLVAAALGIAVACVFYGIIVNVADVTQGKQSYLLIVFPPILAYTMIPLLQGLFYTIYYKFYTMGNNPLYVPSLSEVIIDDEETDQANVENL